MEDPVACSISLHLFLLEMSLSMAERPGQPNGPIKVCFCVRKNSGLHYHRAVVQYACIVPK